MSDPQDHHSTLRIPKRLGKYEIRGVVGEGGMGVVYRGYDADIDRLVAIKVLHAHLKDREFVQRFRQEARAAARCVHRNIVAVFDFGTEDELPYMVMEFVDGIDLRSMLKAEASLPIRQSCDIVLQVLAALEYSHEHGVVHRDIKPGNILLLGDGLVKVADFGVAKLDTSELTHVGYMIGTPSYMSPEGRLGKVVDGRADLYAVGVVLMELLCGMRPHDGRPAPVDEVGPMLSGLPLGEGECRDFQRLIERALAQDPAERFQTAREFADALKTILAPNKVYQPSTAELAATVIATREQINQREHDVRAQAAGTQGLGAPLSQFSLTGEESSLLSQALSSYLGPVSGYVVREASAQCQSFDQLVARLADKIPNQREREQFRRTLQQQVAGTIAATGAGMASRYTRAAAPESMAGSGTGTASHTGAVALSPQQLDELTQRLAVYLGPMASRLVTQMARRATSLEQLQQLVADRIPDVDERRRFLNSL
ncbi:MAG: serine/threonine protein kinase [Gammaproteobacteria bacterium]|nr:serine/threonine protein kinase [Gammaproteobacteria bacterium]